MWGTTPLDVGEHSGPNLGRLPAPFLLQPSIKCFNLLFKAVEQRVQERERNQLRSHFSGILPVILYYKNKKTAIGEMIQMNDDNKQIEGGVGGVQLTEGIFPIRYITPY